MSAPLVSAGCFGKMPALGDFVSRRLPVGWVATWDGWLQHELVRSRAALGDDRWLSLYLVAPVRRFWLARGLLTTAAWLGVLMPSVDSVGRHFPFTLARALEPGRDALADALDNDGWLGDADSLARQVLDPAFGVQALERELAAMPALRDEPAQATRTALAQQLANTCPGLRCAWWCEGANRVADFVLARDLPSEAAFDALLHDPGAAG